MNKSWRDLSYNDSNFIFLLLELQKMGPEINFRQIRILLHKDSFPFLIHHKLYKLAFHQEMLLLFLFFVSPLSKIINLD